MHKLVSGGCLKKKKIQGDHCQTGKEYAKLKVIRKLPPFGPLSKGLACEKRRSLISRCTLILTLRPSYSQNTFIPKYGHYRFISARAAFPYTNVSSKLLYVVCKAAFLALKST